MSTAPALPAVRGKLKAEAPLAPLVWFKSGGNAQWLFEPATIAAPGFDLSDAVGFWDLTNRQDWHVCELQHRGTRSRSWVAGRYSNQEPSVHAFDLMAVDRYARDGVESRRTVRERYDTPVPKEGEGTDGVIPAVLLPRSAARAAARSRAGRR